MERVCVILVNYNGKVYNDKCIESILKSTIEKYLQIVVVDNNSKDGSLELLRKNWSKNEKIHIISLTENYGFSKANNIGIKWALEKGYEYILLLNNDTEIDAQAIERMIALQKETKAVIVPKILYADKPDRIWYAGGDFSHYIKKSKHIGLNDKDCIRYRSNYRCLFANGCCVLLSRKTIDEIGMLDERFFLYYEDTEYSMRINKMKKEIWYCGNAVIYHKVNGSTKGNNNPSNVYYISRNWLICNRIYMENRFYFFLLYYIMNRMCWAMIWMAQGKKELVVAMIKGIRDYQRGKTGKE